MAKAKRITREQYYAQDQEKIRKQVEAEVKAEVESWDLPPDLTGKQVEEHPLYVGSRSNPVRGVVVEARPGRVVVETENLYGVKSRVVLKAVVWQ